MTHEQVEEIIVLLRAIHGAVADVADAVRSHGETKPSAVRKSALKRKGRPDPPMPGEAPTTEPTRPDEPEGEQP